MMISRYILRCDLGTHADFEAERMKQATRMAAYLKPFVPSLPPSDPIFWTVKSSKEATHGPLCSKRCSCSR